MTFNSKILNKFVKNKFKFKKNEEIRISSRFNRYVFCELW